jgi:phosphatidylinositol alpha 1,6-mannosyltransferase
MIGTQIKPDRPLRVALFSGNYNYIRDGANQALNSLVGYLLGQGVSVRVYSPTTPKPAFEPTGTLVSLPSLPFPFGRNDYRFSLGLFGNTLRDLIAFDPDILHVSAPDIAGHRAISWARGRGKPVVASMHTRFETYLGYYRMDRFRPWFEAMLRRFYSRCDAVLAPSPGMAQQMQAEGRNNRFFVWARGIDGQRFNPHRRNMAWRRQWGIADDDVVIGFLGRIVLEKGLDAVIAVAKLLEARNTPYKLLIVGDGPARGWLSGQLPDAIFTGFLSGDELARAVASMDVFFNPSVTEAFGNVTLEAMASGLPVLAANATGSDQLVDHGVTGWLEKANDMGGFADRLQSYCNDAALSAYRTLIAERA